MSSMPWTIIFFNDTATPGIYTLSLHDALPIFSDLPPAVDALVMRCLARDPNRRPASMELLRKELLGAIERLRYVRSEEHTPELQLRQYLVCRFLLEKKQMTNKEISVMIDAEIG